MWEGKKLSHTGFTLLEFGAKIGELLMFLCWRKNGNACWNSHQSFCVIPQIRRVELLEHSIKVIPRYVEIMIQIGINTWSGEISIEVCSSCTIMLLIILSRRLTNLKICLISTNELVLFQKINSTWQQHKNEKRVEKYAITKSYFNAYDEILKLKATKKGKALWIFT